MQCSSITITRTLHVMHLNCFVRWHLRIAGRTGGTHEAGDMLVSLLARTGAGCFIPSLLSTTSIDLTMLFLLLMYFLTQSNLGGDASPIPLMERRTDVPCNDLNQCRTIWSIVWSCLSTVFLCTWVSLHPNITIAPDTRGMSWFQAKVWHPLRAFFKNKLLLFLWALIAPEYILAWATRQNFAAGKIQRECNARQANADQNPVPFREWTRAHGFFVIMGGFHLYSLPDAATSIAYPPELSISSNFVLPLPGHSREDAKAEHPLDFKDLSPHKLAYFAPNETEIKDKGKADIIAKILVLLQTSWFIAQCIARLLEHLPLTELEVVTLAYAMMNMLIYQYWWYKPKDVECPVRVYKAANADGVVNGEKQEWRSGVKGISQRIATYVLGRQDVFCELNQESQVPMFWSGKSGNTIEGISMYSGFAYGMAFGAIHFIAWNSAFPSYIELLLWRISCVAMTVLTMGICLIMQRDAEAAFLRPGFLRLILRSPFPRISMMSLLLTLPVTTLALLYIFARIATLIMAFTTLRALPSDAFKTVDWATFIPHI